MDCPECGTPLVTYRLDDREAPVCERCGHVGIEAEHRAARARMESWTEALERFYDGSKADHTVPVHAADCHASSSRQRAETWTEALERFYGASKTEGDGGGDNEKPTPASVAFEGRAAIRESNSST